MRFRPEDRIDRIVSTLLRGRRIKLGAADADERAAIVAAARLAAARHGPQRMSAAFRKKLADTLTQAPTERVITRRSALVAGLGVVAGAAAGGMFGDRSIEPRLTTAAARGGDPIEPVDGVWTDVAALDDLQEGQGTRITAGSVGAYLFRSGGKVTGVSSVCSHLPCELRWDQSRELLGCPCHPATFTPDGTPADQSYLPALNTVHVRVTAAGRVEVLGTAW